MEWMLLPASKFDITVSNKFPSANKYVAIHLGLFKFSESNNVVCVKILFIALRCLEAKPINRVFVVVVIVLKANSFMNAECICHSTNIVLIILLNNCESVV